MKRFVLSGLIMFLTTFMLKVTAQNVPADFQEHGKNSSGATVATENIDSVTIGSTMNYFVMPDLDVNQDADGPYNYTTNKDALTSTFNWFTLPDLTVTKQEENYVSVDFPSEGDYTLHVSELSVAGCANDTTQIDVRVIGVPEVGYTVADGSEDFCVTGTDGSLSVAPSAMGIIINSDVAGNRDIIVSYRISSTNGSYNGGSPKDVTVNIGDAESSFSLSEDLTHYGVYTVTLTNITDRISRKPATDVNGSLLANTTFTVNITRAPTTGTIYHLPNE